MNVVEIQILPADNKNEASYSELEGIAQDAVGNGTFKSTPETAMSAELTIAKIEGALIGDVRRGARFMEIGLNHQAQFFAMQGRYDTVGKSIRSSLVDGEVHWDSGNMQEVPWSHLREDEHFIKIGDATVTLLKFKTTDGPRLDATDPTKFIYMGDQVDRLTIDMKHQVYFSARTREESVNGSGAVLTQRAKLNWRWHADGIVGDGVIVVNNAVVPSGTWVRSGTGVTGDDFFTRVTNGDVVPNAKANINEPLQGLQGGYVWNVI